MILTDGKYLNCLDVEKLLKCETSIEEMESNAGICSDNINTQKISSSASSRDVQGEINNKNFFQVVTFSNVILTQCAHRKLIIDIQLQPTPTLLLPSCLFFSIYLGFYFSLPNSFPISFSSDYVRFAYHSYFHPLSFVFSLSCFHIRSNWKSKHCITYEISWNVLSSPHRSLNFKLILSSQYVFCNCVLILEIVFFRTIYNYYYSGQLACVMHANNRCGADVRFNQDKTHKFHPI